MPEYPSRDVSTAHAQDIPRDLLQSIVIGELVSPSRPLWVVSPWISDVELVDNTARQFNALAPAWPAARIRLHHVIETLLERGGTVFVVTNEEAHNDTITRILEPIGLEYPESLRLRRAADLHTKGIVGEQFVLDGSMNLTYSGVYRNEEHITYRTDPAVVHERRLELDRWWGPVS